jgi:phosphatidate cytidylyltransferase
MSELGKRVAVAAVGIPTVLAFVWVGGWVLVAPLVVFAVLGVSECHRLSAQKKEVEGVLWISGPAAAALVILAGWQPSFATFAPWALGLVAFLVPLSFTGVMWVRGVDRRPFASVGVTLASTFYVGFALAFAQLLRALPEHAGWSGSVPEAAGLAALTLPLATTWAGDASAFFAGSAWGKAKMAPKISPNKSWVGFWAALAGGGVAATAWAWLVRDLLPIDELGGLPVMAGAGVLLGAAAVLGDLVESMLKREAGVKDSGTFFPGHGGVLDRVDSLLFTIPLAYGLLAALGSVS